MILTLLNLFIFRGSNFDGFQHTHTHSLDSFVVLLLLVTAENGWRCCLINRDRKTPTDYIRNGILYITEK